MAYLDVDTVVLATRAAGDLKGRISVALLKKAVTRLGAITPGDDQREYKIALSVVDGTLPAQWTTVVLGLLDIAGQLSGTTDAQIDTQVNSAWTALTKSR